MSNDPICTEDEIKALVQAFYAVVRKDERLGPIFNGHISDWNAHLEKLEDFWCAILLGSRRFTGTPMPKHIALPDLSAELFEHWLALFRQTLANQPNHALQTQAEQMAGKIANSLWMGYQMHRKPGNLPTDLAIA
ncbi:group III truncated hemoglobin [Methylobacillus caricis]|uniref:group III truncated hemoglobin n=1 Tax=Methylobacillus caricis TaxID=1971611 RepID=UPI001CFFB216|nr:group III truncated hemoglobin [Methylobacillus caricis]MCB5187734.1 group III truncated hemoglobin [Methylobacillus caricis]